MKKLRAIVEYLLGFIIIALLVTSIAGVVVVKVYGEELESYVTDLVNDKINTKVTVNGMDVKVFHKFPKTSIVLYDLTLWSSPNFDPGLFAGVHADTLLRAEQVSISFNLWKLIRKKFDINRVEINRGMVNLLTDEKGEINYRIAKDNDARKGKDSPLVDIGQLRMVDVEVRIQNMAKELEVTGSIEMGDLNGKFTKGNTTLKTSMKGFLSGISNKGIQLSSGQSIEAQLNMDVKDSLFVFNSGHLRIDRIEAGITGQFKIVKEEGVDLDLEARAKNLEIHEFLNLLPGKVNSGLSDIKGSGMLELSTVVTGLTSSTSTPLIRADFLTKNANLSWKKLPFSIKKLNLRGSYTNGGKFSPQSTVLTIESYSAVIGKSRLSGKGQIKNLLFPDFSFELYGDIRAGQWLEWYPDIPLHRAVGSIIPELRVTGSLDRKEGSGKSIRGIDISGNLSVENFSFQIKEDILPFEDVNGSLYIENDFWEPVFSGIFGTTDFHVSGTGLNLLSYLLREKEELIASVKFNSEYFDLQEILDQFPGEARGSKPAVKFPEQMDLRLRFSIRDFTKDLLKAKNVEGVALYDSPFFYVDSLIMETIGGTLGGSFGMVQDNEGSIFANVDADLETLDITRLFEAFHDFGQKQITHEHMKGTISGNSVFSATFNPSFRILPESILSENEVRIISGELNNFTPIMALSRFIEVDELNNIRFSTLENKILIKDSRVIIPDMDIHSNAINLAASGVHHFDNNYEYRLQLKLSDLLYSKAKRASGQGEFEIAEDESDTRTIYLKITDTGSGAKVEMDREETSKRIRENLQNEKTELKRVLNQELGLFKKDAETPSTKEDGERDGAEEEFRFDFTEDDDSTGLQPEKNKNWIRRKTKKDSAENKPAAGFVIDE